MANYQILDSAYKPLLAALAEARANNIVVMPVNWGYIRFALNWLASAAFANADVSNALFFAGIGPFIIIVVVVVVTTVVAVFIQYHHH
jgi:hypothetical protein